MSLTAPRQLKTSLIIFMITGNYSSLLHLKKRSSWNVLSASHCSIIHRWVSLSTMLKRKNTSVIWLSHDNTFLYCASLFLLVSFNQPGIGRRLWTNWYWSLPTSVTSNFPFALKRVAPPWILPACQPVSTRVPSRSDRFYEGSFTFTESCPQFPARQKILHNSLSAVPALLFRTFEYPFPR